MIRTKQQARGGSRSLFCLAYYTILSRVGVPVCCQAVYSHLSVHRVEPKQACCALQTPSHSWYHPAACLRSPHLSSIHPDDAECTAMAAAITSLPAGRLLSRRHTSPAYKLDCSLPGSAAAVSTLETGSNASLLCFCRCSALLWALLMLV